MKLYRLLTVAAFFIAGPALAQNSGTVTNHAFALGKGPGVTGFTSLLCGSAQLAVGQAATDPICRTISGDVTIDAAGVTAIGTAKVTSAMLRNSGPLSVIGRSANTTGVPGDISCSAASDAVLRESGSVLGCGTVATAGIANNAITDAKLRQGVARSVIGVAGNSTANVADIQGATDTILRVTGAGTGIGFGSIDLSKSAAVGSSLLPLANGGCNALLTASNGGILWSNASQCQILAGTATARLPLISGATATPAWAAFSLPASVTSGGIPYFSSTSAMSSSALLTANAIVLGGGAGVTPATMASLGTTTTVLHGNAAGAPTFGAIVAGDVTANTLTNATLATMGAFTFKGNNTSGTAAPTDVDIHALTLKASPAATDEVIISDQAASGAWKRVAVSSLASAGSVSSIDTATGAFTISGLLARSSQDLRVTAVAKSDQTTATSNVLAVTPLHQQDHPSATKFSISCTLSGTTATLRDQYNLNGGGGGSCGRTAVGIFTVTFTTPFATAFYTCVGGTNDRDRNVTVTTKTTTTLTVNTGTPGGALGDFNFDVICTGTQ